MLATERDQISLDFSNKISTSKTLLTETIDDFLKSLIDLMEKVKMKIERRVNLFHDKFEEFYDQFINHSEDFLHQCVKFIQKSSDFEEIKKLYSDNENCFDEILQAEKGPLASEVDYIIKNRQYGRELESLLLKIQQVYEKFNLKNMRDTLDEKLSNKKIPFNSDVLRLILDNANVDITNIMMVEGRFESEEIVPKFKRMDEYQKLKEAIKEKMLGEGVEVKENDDIVVAKQKNLKPRIGDYIKGGKLDEKLVEERTKLKKRIKNLKKIGSPLNKNIQKNFGKIKNEIISGIPSLANISDKKLEINLHFDPVNSKLKNEKSITINEKKQITCITGIDSRNVVIGSKSGILRLIDLKDNKNCLKRCVDLENEINSILPHPDKKFSLLVGLNSSKNSAGGLLREVDLTNQEKTAFFKFENVTNDVIKSTYGNKFKNKDSSLVFSCCRNGQILIHNLKNRKLVSKMTAHNERINDIDYMKNSNILLTGGADCNFRTFNFDLNNLSLKPSFSSQESSQIIKVKAFSKNNSYCAVCLESGEIKIWNIQKKQ